MKSKIGIVIALFFPVALHATTWLVGPTRTYTYCSQVAPLVQNGDTIEIDYATYVNDPQVIWNKNNLYIVGIGDRPRLEAGSIIANDMVNGKGIFVISGNNVHVHNIEFANAVVQDNNGAGIRQEGANLLITQCKFTSNEMGILCGNISNCKTTIEYSEFVNGGSSFNPGYQHNIYINHIDTFVFRYNYTHDAIAEGHELKSRANYNFILYNRIANEQSEDSRTIDLPNGGTSVVVGNIIEQGPNSANSNLLGYGLEGLSNPAPQVLFCSSNTFINNKTTGSFIQVANGTDTLFVKNNIFAGAKTGGLFIGSPAVLDSSGNLINNSISAFGFVDEATNDFHLLPNSPAIDVGVNITRIVHGYPLQPFLIYKDTCLAEPRVVNGSLDVGAYEYSPTLGIFEKDLEGIEIFPNPATNTIYIQLGNEIHQLSTLHLFSISGEILTSKILQHGENSIDISSWADGIYFILIQTGKNQMVHTIVVH